MIFLKYAHLPMRALFFLCGFAKQQVYHPTHRYNQSVRDSSPVRFCRTATEGGVTTVVKAPTQPPPNNGHRRLPASYIATQHQQPPSIADSRILVASPNDSNVNEDDSRYDADCSNVNLSSVGSFPREAINSSLYSSHERSIDYERDALGHVESSTASNPFL